MTNDIFAQQLTLSRQRLEQLWRRADNLPKSSVKLSLAEKAPTQEQEVLIESLEELSHSLEELQVAVEEINQQHEELIATRLILATERQRYQDLFEFAPYGYLVTTKEGVIREANLIAAELLNICQKYIIGKPLVLYVAPEERRNFNAKLIELQKGQLIQNWLISIQPRQGNSFTASFTVTPEQDLQGQVVGLRWHFSELTPVLVGDWKSGRLGEWESGRLGETPVPFGNKSITLSPASSTQQQSEDLFRAMFENAAVGLALLDSKGYVIQSNQALQQMLGNDSVEDLQTVLLQLMNLDKDGVESALFQQLMAGQRCSYQIEKRFTRNTSVQWGRLTISLVQGVGEEPRFATCMLEDITAQRQLEEIKRQSIEQLDVSHQQQTLASTQPPTASVEQLAPVFDEILSSSADFFFVLDRTGKYLYVNRTAAAALGFAQSDFSGKTWQQLNFPSEIMERVETQWEDVFRTGKPCSAQVSFPTVNGIRDYEYRISKISDIHSGIEAIAITAKDVTEQKRTMAAATEALAKQVEYSALNSHFASIVSHELRSPLNNIFCCVKLIEGATKQGNEEKKRGYIQRIQNNVKRINRLLDNLLVMGKVEAGQLQLNPSLIDINVFCSHLIEELQQGQGREHKLTFISQGQRSALWDANLLRQILTNLLLNGIKYSPQGNEILLNVFCQDNKAIFRIQDSGIGIPEQDQVSLFKVFHRGSNVGNVPGTGLGLSIVKQCVELHNGEISVESIERVGTTFTVTLPLKGIGSRRYSVGRRG